MNASVHSRVARLLLKKLSEECESYCILSGYEELPDRFDSDIDFMVSPRDFERIPALVAEIAAATGTCLFQVVPHEPSARAFRLAAGNDGGLTFVQPDVCSDYRHYGKLWLRADEVLAGRRLHWRGFWIPSAACEFIYYLIKRVNKRDFTSVHGARLSRLYREDPIGCERQWHRFLDPDFSNALAQMVLTGDWQPMMWNIEYYRRELRNHSIETSRGRMVSYVKRARHTMERILQPTGGWIAFMGPDGCGKSSVIDTVAAEFAPAFQKIERFHLRPKSLPARPGSEAQVTDPHGKPSRGAIFSIAKMLYLFADYWLGYLSSVRTATMRTKLVLFDRYFYDILVDPRRILYGGPGWLPRMLAKLVPRPDMIVLLNAAPEVLWSRKQEVGYEEVVRQQSEYLRVARELGDTVVIDASATRREVSLRVREAILAFFSRRTQHRLMLAKAAGPAVEERVVPKPLTMPSAAEHVYKRGLEIPGTGVTLDSIFSGASSGRSPAEAPEVRVQVISQGGVPRWVLPEDTRNVVTVLKSWKPYKATSRLQWKAIIAASKMNALAALPGVAQETVRCDLSYWRRCFPWFSDSWSMVAYIGNPFPTRKAVLFFVNGAAKVRAVAKVPIYPAAREAILNEARILTRLRNRLPLPEVLFMDSEEGIAAQSWMEGVNVSRKFGEEQLALLNCFASEEGRVRLSDCRAGLEARVAQVDGVDPGLLQRALSFLDVRDELRACVEHGDFVPWNLRRLADGRLTLLDWEWAVEEGYPWQDVCRYFYLQDYLFRESADVWEMLVTNPLLAEYRRDFGLSSEAVRGLTLRYLLRYMCDEHAEGNRDRVQYAARRIQEIVNWQTR